MLSPFDHLPFTTYSWLMFCGAAMSLCLFLYGLLQRTSYDVGVWFSYLCLGEFIYTFGYGMELACRAVGQTHFWLTFEMLGGSYLPCLIILMAYTYRYHTKAPLWLTTGLLVVSSTTLAIQFGNENHGLIFKSVELTPHEGMSISLLEFGPWFYVHMVYINIAMIISTSFFYQCWRQAPKNQQYQVFLILLGSIPPWFFYVIYLLDWAPYGLDLSAFGFLVTGPLYAYSLFRYRFADLLPIARAHIFENLEEGILVVDTEWRVIDSNSRARQIVSINQANSVQTCPAQLKELAQKNMIADENNRQPMEQNQHSYDIECHSLGDDSTQLGYVLRIRDITERLRELSLLKNHAQLDDLTGVLNRRMILEQLELIIQLQWSSSGQRYFSLILFDIDLFKKINDSQGHPIGDLILKQLASLLQQQMQVNEQLGRYGGDEFIILSTGINPTEVEERAEQLRSIVSNQLGITLSMGLTHYQSNDIPRLMLQRADYALYQAKSAGRNRICTMQEQLEGNRSPVPH